MDSFSFMDTTSSSNVTFAKLNKKLGSNSNSIGDQCEAIVRYPVLFERYPFPLFINPASLLLSEVYRDGSNFVRLLILQVIKDCDKHIDKILNLDTFVHNVFAVSYSNDSQARSITLRVLGCIARVSAHNKSIHHFIRKSLDSNDESEVSASIEASVRYAAESKDFAQTIYPKIMSMIDGLTTSMPTKVSLLDVINNLNHNFVIAEDARTKLVGFLSKYPGTKFVCKNLHTLTSIALASVFQVPEQVEMLLHFYVHDPRTPVKMFALENLKILAKKSAHLWNKNSIVNLFNSLFSGFTTEEGIIDVESVVRCKGKKSKLLCQGLSVMNEYLCSPLVSLDSSLLHEGPIKKYVEFCCNLTYQSSTEKVSTDLLLQCFNMMTNVCLLDKSDETFLEKTCTTFELFLLAEFNGATKNTSDREVALKRILITMVRLCRANECSPQRINQITDALAFIFINGQINLCWHRLVTETICALGYVVRANDSIDSSDVLQAMSHRFGALTKWSRRNECSVIKHMIVYLQMNTNRNHSAVRDSETISNILSGVNLFVVFKIVRQAMRYAHHGLAHVLLKQCISNMEPTESTYFFLNSLSKVSSAENYLQPEDVSTLDDDSFDNRSYDRQLSAAISTYVEGYNQLKAAVSSSNPLKFKCDYIRLRIKTLQAHQQFRLCCKLLQTSPPPMASSLGTSGEGASIDDPVKCGRIASSMQKCSQEFRQIAESYSQLHTSSFNADDNTLSYVQLLQHSCTIFAEIIENLFQNNPRINSLFVTNTKASSFNHGSGSSTSSDNDHIILEHKPLEDVCTLISNMVQSKQLLSLSTFASSGNGDKVEPVMEFTKVFTKQVVHLLNISTRLLLTPLAFPRFFFQKVQNIQIKLELSQQARNDSEILHICFNTQFVFHVEGVVTNHIASPENGSLDSSLNNNNTENDESSQATNDQRIIRNVNKILLTLTATPIASNSVSDIQSSLGTSPAISMHSIVTPLNDYFQTQFLLTFPSAGFFSIAVDTSVIDDNEAQWKTGPIQRLVAKVDDYNKQL